MNFKEFIERVLVPTSPPKDEIGLLVEKSFQISGSEQGKEDPFVHFGYLGLPKPDVQIKYYLAALNQEEEKQLSRYFNEHRKDKGIYCEMDAIGVLFPNRLVEITSEQLRKLESQTDPIYDSY